MEKKCCTNCNSKKLSRYCDFNLCYKCCNSNLCLYKPHNKNNYIEKKFIEYINNYKDVELIQKQSINKELKEINKEVKEIKEVKEVKEVKKVNNNNQSKISIEKDIQYRIQQITNNDLIFKKSIYFNKIYFYNEKRKELFNYYIDKEFNNEFLKKIYNDTVVKKIEYKLISQLSLKVIDNPYILECLHIFNKSDLEYLFNKFKNIKEFEFINKNNEIIEYNKLNELILFKCPICKKNIKEYLKFSLLLKFINDNNIKNNIIIEYSENYIDIKEINKDYIEFIE